MIPYIILWVAIMVIAVVVELETAQLVSVWFAAGAIAALIAAFFDATVILQILIFFIVSGITLLGFFPLRKKYLKDQPQERTNADRILGDEAVVVQKIDNVLGRGQVNVRGQIWTARTTDNAETIDEGQRVEVLRIEGVKAIVQRV